MERKVSASPLSSVLASTGVDGWTGGKLPTGAVTILLCM